jgi:quercetin dioxygenase-like cupin family protein
VAIAAIARSFDIRGLGRDQLARKRQLAFKEQKMSKMVLFLALALGSVLAVSGANAGTGKATTLMTKELPDFPGKEGMVEIVEFAPGEVSQPHRHNADLFVYVLEGSIITQVKGGNAETVHAGGVFYESPTDIHSVSRNASATQPAKLLVFYVKVKGAPPTVLLTDGEK